MKNYLSSIFKFIWGHRGLFIALFFAVIFLSCMLVLKVVVNNASKVVKESRTGSYIPTDNPVKESSIQSESAQSPVKSSSKPYVKGECTTTPLPYKTVYKDAGWLAKGETDTIPGVNGFERTCTADSNGNGAKNEVFPPGDEIIYKGAPTKSTFTPSTITNIPVPTPTPQTPKYTYEEAAQRASSYCRAKAVANNAGGGSFIETCIQQMMQSYGY